MFSIAFIRQAVDGSNDADDDDDDIDVDIVVADNDNDGIDAGGCGDD